MTREHLKSWALCVMFWVAIISSTHDMTEATTCVAKQGPSAMERVVELMKVKLWQ